MNLWLIVSERANELATQRIKYINCAPSFWPKSMNLTCDATHIRDICSARARDKLQWENTANTNSFYAYGNIAFVQRPWAVHICEVARCVKLHASRHIIDYTQFCVIKMERIRAQCVKGSQCNASNVQRNMAIPFVCVNFNCIEYSEGNAFRTIHRFRAKWCTKLSHQIERSGRSPTISDTQFDQLIDQTLNFWQITVAASF